MCLVQLESSYSWTMAGFNWCKRGAIPCWHMWLLPKVNCRVFHLSKTLVSFDGKGERIYLDTGVSRSIWDAQERLGNCSYICPSEFLSAFHCRYRRESARTRAVLSQCIEGQEKVIGYASRTLSKSERKYCVIRNELLAGCLPVTYYS